MRRAVLLSVTILAGPAMADLAPEASPLPKDRPGVVAGTPDLASAGPARDAPAARPASERPSAEIGAVEAESAPPRPLARPAAPEEIIATMGPGRVSPVARPAGAPDRPGAAALALSRAIDLARAGRFGEAERLVAPHGEVARDVVIWHELRARRGSWSDARDFVRRNADWPGLPLLKARSEKLIPRGAAPEEVLEFFGDEAPRTGTGALRLAAALRATGDEAAAEAELKRAWRDLPMSEPEERAVLSAAGALLSPLHAERLDGLLWQASESGVQRAMDRADDGLRAVAKARMALRANRDGVDKLIEAVPERLADDAGLAYDRFSWRLKRKRTGDAVDLMLERSTSAAALGRPEVWAHHREKLARDLMEDGRAERAYAVAANHFLTEGSEYRELEWLAGFVALTDLDLPADALAHFEDAERESTTPLSLARMQYWQGRAHEALDQDEAAQEDFARAAAHQTVFYGQLAAERIGAPVDPALAAAPAPAVPGALPTGSVLEAAGLLLEADQWRLAARFLSHLAESQDRAGIEALGAWAEAQGSEYLEVALGKRAALGGEVVPSILFPVHRMAEMNLVVPPELALAVSRQESEFHPGVASHVGAQGLMQLMPATAREVSAELGLRYALGRLTAEPEYNVVLGTAYLKGLEDRFGYNVPMIAAGYNAGPGRPARWARERGDPRRMSVDQVVDWIEHIPFEETRIYVQRVTENVPVYRMRLSGEVEPLGIGDLLTGRRRGEG